MKRRRHRTELETHAWGEIHQRAMIDLFLLFLLGMIVMQPQFGVQGVTLPELVVQESAPRSGGEAGSGAEIRLKADGSIIWKGSAIPGEGAGARIAAEAPGRDAIVLVIETGESGSGALQAFLQLQMDLSRAGIWHRVCVLSQPASTRAIPSGPQGVQP